MVDYSKKTYMVLAYFFSSITTKGIQNILSNFFMYVMRSLADRLAYNIRLPAARAPGFVPVHENMY